MFTSIFLAAAVAVASEDAATEKTKFLSYLAPNLEAGRYDPADEGFSWVGWIGADVNLVERGPWSLYFAPNVETILGHRVRTFEAVQANYSLEVGGHRQFKRVRVSPFFHHVSRHIQDRDKQQAIDWNFLGAQVDGGWPERWKRRGGFAASFAAATLSSGVEYKWEARGSGDIDAIRRGHRALFVLADFRHVAANSVVNFPRTGFTDVRLEAGFRHWQETSQFSLFVAYERRNDALIDRALVKARALFGFRIRGTRTPVPATVPLP